ncbi:inorganic pyrophosphatase [Anopheles sinensis]|uniref:Inorganic pyrophosphatase n=1 Tax=Anopheles sinensis TaxID=74873 RepID=A0A084VFH9_ANOSI|nr:inorganic pyrophosphatase [Anopheles sinensis]
MYLRNRGSKSVVLRNKNGDSVDHILPLSEILPFFIGTDKQAFSLPIVVRVFQLRKASFARLLPSTALGLQTLRRLYPYHPDYRDQDELNHPIRQCFYHSTQ